MFCIFSSQSIVQRSGRALWQPPCRIETQSPLATWPMKQISTHGPVFMATGMLSITPPTQPYTKELRSSGVGLSRTQTIWHLKMLLRLLHEVLGHFGTQTLLLKSENRTEGAHWNKSYKWFEIHSCNTWRQNSTHTQLAQIYHTLIRRLPS